MNQGEHRQGALTYRIERLDTSTWRVHHHPEGSVASYDLRTRPRALSDFADRCRRLATAPDSPFVRVLVAQHHRDGHELALRSRIVGSPGKQRVLTTVEGFAEALGRFRIPAADLGTDAVRSLWDRTESQYSTWLELRSGAAR